MPPEESADEKGRLVRSRPVRTFAYVRRESDGEDPNDLESIYDYWAYDQLTEFIEWLFRAIKEGKR